MSSMVGVLPAALGSDFEALGQQNRLISGWNRDSLPNPSFHSRATLAHFCIIARFSQTVNSIARSNSGAPSYRY